ACPGLTGRFAPQQQPAQPADGAPQLTPDQLAANKPGAGRGIKKKKVVKKGSTDLAAEREMRGLRVPKKRRALPGKEQRKTEITTPRASKRVVRITEGVTVGDLGRSMGVKAGDLIKKLMELGQMATSTRSSTSIPRRCWPASSATVSRTCPSTPSPRSRKPPRKLSSARASRGRRS